MARDKHRLPARLWRGVQAAGRRLRLRHLALAALAVYLACLLPLLLLAGNNYASVDDFGYTAATHAAWTETGSLWAVLAAAARECVVTWQDWQGSFAAIFLMALQPGIFSDGAYALTTWLMAGALTAGVLLLCRAVFGRLYGAGRAGWLLAGLWVLFFAVQTPPSPVQGFFWYNGSVYYTFIFSLALVMFALLIVFAGAGRDDLARAGQGRRPADGGKGVLSRDGLARAGHGHQAAGGGGVSGRGELVQADLHKGQAGRPAAKHRPARAACLAGATALAVFTGGGNYITALQCFLAFALLILLLVWHKNPAWRWVLLPLAVHAGCFALSAAAPGNAVRAATEFAGHQPSAAGTVLRALGSALACAGEWLTLPLAAALALLAPVLWRLAAGAGNKPAAQTPAAGGENAAVAAAGAPTQTGSVASAHGPASVSAGTPAVGAAETVGPAGAAAPAESPGSSVPGPNARPVPPRFRLPLLVSLLSWGFLAAGFCPPLYAMDSIGDGRILNIQYYLFLLLLVFNLFYWLGWLAGRLAAFQAKGQSLQAAVLQYLHRLALPGLAGLALLLAVCLAATGGWRQITAYSATRSLASGEAAEYGRQMRERIAMVEGSDGPVVALPPLTVRPRELFFADLNPDPNYFSNQIMAEYYGKARIELLPPEGATDADEAGAEE